MMKFTLVPATLALCLISLLPAHAEEHQIRMLNFGTDGGMVFEPGFLKVAPGDSITFVPENSGHWVRLPGLSFRRPARPAFALLSVDANR